MSDQTKTPPQQAALSAARKAAYAAIAGHEHDMATNPEYKALADSQMQRREAAAVKAGRTMVTDAQLNQARRIVENEDYMPWSDVKAAKKLLGIAEPDHVAEVTAELARSARPD